MIEKMHGYVCSSTQRILEMIFLKVPVGWFMDQDLKRQLSSVFESLALIAIKLHLSNYTF